MTQPPTKRLVTEAKLAGYGRAAPVLSNFSWRAMRDAFLAAGAAAYFDKAMEFNEARDWIAARRSLAA